MPTSCEVPDCVAAAVANGLCGRHYQRKRKTGTTDERPRRVAKAPAPCSMDGCTGIANVPGTGLGLCSMHYARKQRTGDPLTTLRELKKVTGCSVPGCERKHWSGGLCSMHYQRKRQTGTTDDPVRVTDGERYDACVSEPNERGCRLWTGHQSVDGYGRFSVTPSRGSKQKHYRAHRWGWERANGPIPEGLMLLHSCDVPLCVALDHLRPGTGSENKQDELARGRNNPPRGTRNPKAVLTEDMVRSIRILHSYRIGARRQSRIFGVSEGAIKSVLEGRTWKHVV